MNLKRIVLSLFASSSGQMLAPKLMLAYPRAIGENVGELYDRKRLLMRQLREGHKKDPMITLCIDAGSVCRHRAGRIECDEAYF